MVTVRPIVQGDVPELRQQATPITDFGSAWEDLQTDLFDTLTTHRALGLAAPQIGIAQQAILIDDGSGPLLLANPEIVEQSGAVPGFESCLSFPDIVLEVLRPDQIRVSARDAHGVPLEIRAQGLRARIICHEVDHLKGVLFMDGLSDEELFEQLVANTVVPGSTEEEDDRAALASSADDSDLEFAANLFAEAAWKATLAKELIADSVVHPVLANAAIDRAIRTLESAVETLEQEGGSED